MINSSLETKSVVPPVARHSHMRVTLERVAAPLAAIAIALLSSPDSLAVTLIAWLTVLSLATASRGSRYVMALFLSLTIYASTAWLVARLAGQYFPPFPSMRVIEDVTLSDLRSILLAFALIQSVLGSRFIQARFLQAAKAVRSRIASAVDSGVTLTAIVFVITSAVATLNLLGIAQIGIGAILNGERREFASLIPLAANHNVQALTMAATVVGLIAIIVRPRKTALIQLSIALCWIPYVLVGSRKELLIVGIAVLLAVIENSSRRLKILLGLSAVALLAFPAIRERNIFYSLHEFILPQHMHFALAMGVVPPEFGGSFWSRSQFLLPSPLRWSAPVDLGSAFYMFGATNVGVGVSPFAEASMTSKDLPTELVFALTFFAIILIIAQFSRGFPAITVIGYAQLLVFGRSDTWIAAFFIIYCGIAVSLILSLGGSIDRKVSRSAEHGRQTRGAQGLPGVALTAERVVPPHSRRAVDESRFTHST